VNPKRVATPGQGPIGPAPYGGNVYFSFEGANPEAFDHLHVRIVNGTLELAFETFVHTGDRDYDDLIVTATGFDLGGTGYFAYDAHATDVDGDTLTYRFISAPAAAQIDPETGLVTFQAQSGSYDFIVGVSDAHGGDSQQSFTLTVTPQDETPLQVHSVAATSSGFRARFNQAFDPETINLYDAQDTHLGPADIVFNDPNGALVHGSLVLDQDNAGFTFVKTGGPLDPGAHALTLKSGPNAFADLDGNGNGLPGDDYSGTITIGPNTLLGRIGIADGIGAPGQSVENGIGITLTSNGLVNAARFALLYDPSLLTPESAELAAGLPAGTFLSVNFGTPGYARFTLSAPKALPGGTIALITLRASVPSSAPYGAKQVLDVVDVFVNGSLHGADDDAIQALALIELTVRAKDTASGTLDLDLHTVFLNEGRLTLDPLPVRGADAADGRIEITAGHATPSAETGPAPAGTTAPEARAQVPPTSTLSRLLGRLREALLGSVLARLAPIPVELAVPPTLPILADTREAVRTASTAAEAPTVDLAGTTSTRGRVGGDGTGANIWKRQFVMDGLGTQKNPNATLSVTLPAVREATTKVDAIAKR